MVITDNWCYVDQTVVVLLALVAAPSAALAESKFLPLNIRRKYIPIPIQ